LGVAARRQQNLFRFSRISQMAGEASSPDDVSLSTSFRKVQQALELTAMFAVGTGLAIPAC